MTYPETIDYLLTRLPMFSRIGAAAIKADLHNTYKILESLDNPHQSFKSVHIAGTNGKGSVSHMLAAIFQQCGYKTGLYTSPHLRDFRERIRIDGKMIDEEFVVSFTEQIKPVIDDISPSFFEISVGMAFSYFKFHQVDIAVIEVGLGGRLDSTNVITPQLSVITNIGMDHMNLLGNTIELIAGEKAGIIKEGIPVIIGESSVYADDVFIQVAADKKAPLVFADKVRYAADWYHSGEGHHTENWVPGSDIQYIPGALVAGISNHDDTERISYTLDLPGYYQLKNLITTLEAASCLRQMGWRLPQQQIQAALRQVKKMTGLHGRWEVISYHPKVVLDVGHNEDGIAQIVAQVELSEYHSLHIVVGMVKDKEVEKALALLPQEATYYFTQARIPRAMPAGELMDKAIETGLHGKSYTDVNAALEAALGHAGSDDMILVCGSVFIVGEIDQRFYAGN